MKNKIKVNGALEQLKDFIRLQVLLETSQKVESRNTESIPVMMVSAEVIQMMLKHIATTNEMLTRLVKRPTDMWLTHKEALEFFDVSENTLRNYVDSGWLACTIFERKKYFHFSDIEKFLTHPDNHKKAFQLGN